jgi:hypothetical protein
MPAMRADIQAGAADDDLVAAALAAVALYLDAEQAGEGAGARSAWRVAAILAADGGTAPRGVHRVSWPSAERAERGGRWSPGLPGAFD